MFDVNSKELMIVGGPNGSGKTTFARVFLKKHKFKFLSADNIAREINSENIDRAKFRAGREYYRRLEKDIDRGNNILIESTLSGVQMKKMIPRFQNFDYNVSIIFIFLDSPILCIERIKERLLKGGHPIPDQVVHRRFYRSIDNFWNNYKNKADHWYLFYNAEDRFRELAFGVKKNFIVKNQEIFNTFVSNIK
jgi:predicted ABC-type ATPase